jgi:uncharacterized protein YjbJ (UPF0337 family)
MCREAFARGRDGQRPARPATNVRRPTVNRDEVKGKWRQLRGRIKQRWGKLTGNDVVKIEGDYDRLIGKIQERYGTTRKAVRRRLHDLRRAGRRLS